jgi:hypothetical protein
LSADDLKAFVGTNMASSSDVTWTDIPQVVQEAVLAKSSLRHWAKVQIDLIDVYRVAMWLLHKTRYITESLRSTLGWKSVLTVLPFHDLGSNSTRQPVVRRVIELLQLAYIFQKTEPRDVVYAMLGLRSWKEDPGLEDEARAALLKVDYTKPVADIIRDVTRYGLIEAESLTPIYQPGRNFEDDDYEFVSWAVRADRPRFAGDAPLFPKSSFACKGLEAASLFHNTSHGHEVLLIQGFFADRVADVTASCDKDFWCVEDLHLWLIQAKQAVQRNCDRRGMELPIIMDFRITCALTVGQGPTGLSASVDNLTILKEYIRDCEMLSRDAKTKTQRDKVLLKDMETSLNHCSQRRFFVTAEGRMGIGPSSMRADDCITIARGAIQPLILRKTTTGPGYLLMGDTYVERIMHGQTLEEWKARGEPEQIFQLI